MCRDRYEYRVGAGIERDKDTGIIIGIGSGIDTGSGKVQI